MKEFVASIREINANFLISEEEKGREMERIEREGVGVLRVTHSYSGSGWTTTKESTATFIAARGMGYTYFDCVEVGQPKPQPRSEDEGERRVRLGATLDAWESVMLPNATGLFRGGISRTPAPVRAVRRSRR